VIDRDIENEEGKIYGQACKNLNRQTLKKMKDINRKEIDRQRKIEIDRDSENEDGKRDGQACKN
jgi:hypothetical protein